MEYCSGGELFDYIVSKQRLKEREACRFFQDIISGILYLSKVGVWHRDLKPENLLLDFNKSIKIVDFGLSNVYTDASDTLKTAWGSPWYAAPEMIEGKRYNGLWVDIWSSGVVLYAMVWGYLPFEDPVTANLYKKIIRSSYELPKWVSKPAAHLLSRVLDTNPNKRANIKEIQLHPWYKQVKENNVNKSIKDSDRLSIIDTMEELGFNSIHLENCLKENKHNHVTTTYYLLWKKTKKQAFKGNKIEQLLSRLNNDKGKLRRF